MTPMEAVEGGKPGEWIERHAGPCPVDGATLVDVKFICGKGRTKTKARSLEWGEDGPGTIVAYRVVQP